jgi:hypothetical protein
MSFQTAAKKAQARARRPVGELLPSYFENLTEEEKRDCLKQVLFTIDDQIANCDLRDKNGRYRKKELGQEKAAICKLINALRPKRRAPGVEFYFIEAARETLTKVMFSIVMDKAVVKLRESEKRSTP